MRMGVLGTGTVGQTVGTKLAELGHEVVLGARQATNEKAIGWAERTGGGARAAAFADAAAHGEMVFNATAGVGSLAALGAAGAANLAGKVLVDIANPLDFSAGMPPSLTIVNTDSLGEAIQREFPDARVVKALSTVTARVMVDPSRLPGEHNLPIAGDDAEAKRAVLRLLGEFGWPAESVIDLGGITAARAMEMYLPLWLRLAHATGTADFNIKVIRA